MVVVSDPLAELVGGGRNAKYIKDCEEIYLGGKQIEQLAGFERLVNLEVLWLNNNKLQAIANLNANIRIKSLYVQDNRICTLKGSLLHFKFLQLLDVSNNVLSNLDKVLAKLQKLQFLETLNLKGNPCCEEPDYRLRVISALPSVRVLDDHVITPGERRQATALLGSAVALHTTAFGEHLPPVDPETLRKVPEVSELEAALNREVADIRQRRVDRLVEEEQRLYGVDPYAAYYDTAGRPLPPPAGLCAAHDTWRSASSHTLQTGSQADGLLTQQGSRKASGYKPKDILILRTAQQAAGLSPTAGQQHIVSKGTFKHAAAAPASWTLGQTAMMM